MARTTIPVTVLYPDQDNANPGTTVITAADGMILDAFIWNPSLLRDGLLLEVTQTAADPAAVIFRAGSGPQAMRAGIGDLVVSLAQDVTAWFCLESARFQQPEGQLLVDFDAGFTGTIRAVQFPQR
jgi:hypothetical protein